MIMMKQRKLFMTFIISSFIFLMGSVAYSQSADDDVSDNSSDSSYEVGEIVQKFKWQGNKNVFRYELVIELLSEELGEYVQLHCIDTKETEVRLPLKAGKYRYYLNVYNYLNSLDFRTDYQTFEIQKTYQPIITSVSPTIIYLEDAQSGIFTVEGMNLRPETIFTVESDIYEIPAKILSTDSEFKRSRIKINPELLDTGTYYIRAVNNGGLFDTSGTIKVSFRKTKDLNVSIDYAPVALLDIDSTKPAESLADKDTLIEFFSDDDRSGVFWPLGFDGRVSFLPYKTANIFLGAEFGINFFNLKYTNSINGQNSYTIRAPAYSMHLDFVSQFILKKSLPWKIVLDTHIGGGLFGFAGMTTEYPNLISKPMWSADVSANAGFALQIYRWSNVFMEAGTDFVFAATSYHESDSSPMMVYYIQPRVGIGWQF